MTWARSEQMVADMLGGHVVSDKASQYLDLDVLCPDGLAVSVKEQRKALVTGNVSFELALFDAAGGSYPGNWAKCQADVLAIVIPTKSVTFYECHELASYLRSLPAWDVRRLTDLLVQRNVEAGRKMVDALNLIVPISQLKHLAYRTETL